MEKLIQIIVILAGVLLYFFPAIIAKRRKHRNFELVLVINAFTGWTIIGWIVSLAIGVYRPRERGVYSRR